MYGAKVRYRYLSDSVTEARQQTNCLLRTCLYVLLLFAYDLEIDRAC